MSAQPANSSRTPADTAPLQGEKLSRVGDAYARLKEEILTNAMPPGFQAPEPEIAARLGMSRTPVREALIRLEAEGLVQLIPRRGARVLPVVAADMQEIYEILTTLEPTAAANLAARRPSGEELEALEQAMQEMERTLESNDLNAWAAADDRYHRELLRLHGNRRLEAVVATLYDQAHRARMVTLRLRQKPVRSTQEHRDILDCLRAGDAEGAKRIFTEHRERSARELVAILQNYGLPPL